MTNDACSFYTHVQKLEVFFTFLFLSYWQLFMSLQLKIKNLINSNVALLTLETRVHTKCSVSWCCLLISALNVGMYQVKQNFPSKSVIKLIKYLIYFSLVSYTFLLCIFMLMKQYLLIYIVYICWHWPEVDEKEIGTPEKYPEHTFEVSHSRRRSYLITAYLIYLSVVHFHVNETIFINLYCLYLLTLTRGRREGDRHPRKVPWTHIWGFPL